MMQIRNASPEDAERLLEIYGYYVENTAVSFECETPSVEEFRNRIRKTLLKYPYLVLEEDGEIKGYAYAGPLDGRAAYFRSCVLSIYLDRTSVKKGFGRALYDEIEHRLKALGMTNMYACVASPVTEDDKYLTRNSEQFHRHLGFSKAGELHGCGFKFGRRYSIVWMEKIIAGEGLQ